MIAAASAHRADAFAACRYAIERVKQIAPVWKHEHFDGGDVWIEGAIADPEDAGARSSGDRAGMLVTIRLFARLREMAGAVRSATGTVRTAPRLGTAWDALAAEFPASRITHARCRARSTKNTRA